MPDRPAPLASPMGRLIDAAEAELGSQLAERALDDPFAPAGLRWGLARGLLRSSDPLLSRWLNRRPLLAGEGPTPPRIGIEACDGVLPWRPREVEVCRADPTAFARRLLGPVIEAETIELLAELSSSAQRITAETAARLLDAEALLAEDGLAGRVQALDTWSDSFALWLFSRRPQTLARFHPLLTALAARLAVSARRGGGTLRGRSFPFAGEPLVSASAHLASAISLLGIYPSLLPSLIAFVADEQRADGGWGDPGQPSDPLTSLAAADLLARLSPDFDAEALTGYLAAARGAGSGGWQVIGPERTWLSAELAGLLSLLERPFAGRFRWPALLPWLRDRHTGLPGYGYFSDLARLFAELPALAVETVEVTFCDLAGFGAWNTAHGQAEGDEALRLVAEALDALPAARAVRDGGDEFVIVGAPRRSALRADLEQLLTNWPARWKTAFGERPVVPLRMVLTRAPGAGLLACRERLGKAIGDLKAVHPAPPPSGVLVDLDAPVADGAAA